MGPVGAVEVEPDGKVGMVTVTGVVTVETGTVTVDTGVVGPVTVDTGVVGPGFSAFSQADGLSPP